MSTDTHVTRAFSAAAVVSANQHVSLHCDRTGDSHRDSGDSDWVVVQSTKTVVLIAVRVP